MIAGILLAAGASTRFGGDKRLFPLPDGTPIGVQAARNLLNGVDLGIAVLRPDDRQLAQRLESEGLRVVFCPGAEAGMGASLAFGVAAARDADGWLIALADMPYVRPGTVRSLADLLRAGAPIAAPYRQDRRGHPVGFNREFFAELTRLSGDEGARGLLKSHADRIRMLECADPGIFADIDAPADLAEAGGSQTPGCLLAGHRPASRVK